MSREIKFRAWDSIEKEMISYSQRDPIHFRLTPDQGLIPMQYTGKKDENGRNIYEGDVLETFHFVDRDGYRHYLRHVVIWCDFLAGWRVIPFSKTWKEGDGGNPQLWTYLKDDARIVGNKYENPELLKP